MVPYGHYDAARSVPQSAAARHLPPAARGGRMPRKSVREGRRLTATTMEPVMMLLMMILADDDDDDDDDVDDESNKNQS